MSSVHFSVLHRELLAFQTQIWRRAELHTFPGLHIFFCSKVIIHCKTSLFPDYFSRILISFLFSCVFSKKLIPIQLMHFFTQSSPPWKAQPHCSFIPILSVILYLHSLPMKTFHPISLSHRLLFPESMSSMHQWTTSTPLQKVISAQQTQTSMSQATSCSSRCNRTIH